jgi:Zn-finger nucleic acid-binding protein
MALILCPRDRHLLVQDDPARQPCRKCGGVFVRREAVEELFEELKEEKGGVMMLSPYRSAPGMQRAPRPEAPVEAELRYLSCPYCSKQMNRHTLFKDFRLVVDMCVNHGVWFDGEELKRCADFVRANTPAGADGEEVTSDEAVQILLRHFFPGSGDNED